MKRIKLEVLYHVGDKQDEKVFADRLIEHMRTFRCPERSRNATVPHHEELKVFAERCAWDTVESDHG